MSKKDSKKPEYYQDYLELDRILNSQHPNSIKQGKQAHDEMLFIIIHQVYELWFKQIIYELDSIIDIFSKEDINESNIGTAVSRLERIIEIQKILIDQVGVLETMTPMDFLDFRDFLVPASGFQSKQFRLIENKLGLDKKKRYTYGNSNYKTYLNKEDSQEVKISEEGSNLFVLMEKWLERTPFLQWGKTSFWKEYESAIDDMLNDDFSMIDTNNDFSEEEKKIHIKHHETTKKSLEIGIQSAILNNNIGDIGFAIQKYAESFGYSVVRELVGHGIGANLHEEPQVPNYGNKGSGAKIELGMCLAIEPMINLGSPEIYTKDDNWTVCTQDGNISAHFEHSIAITDKGTKILTI